MRELERQVAALTAPPEGPVFRGALLESETVLRYYRSLRERGVRFVVLRVHPALADEAVGIVAALEEAGRWPRGIREVRQAEDVPECGWEVVPFQR